MKEYFGCWPTMITPFTEKGEIDYRAVKALVDWYVELGADGIFAVCQSSEMFFLSEKEKTDLARAVVEYADNRIRVIASGHTADDHACQIEQLGRMAETGVDAVVLVSNRLAAESDPEELFVSNAHDIFSQLPGVKFGLYECPFPYLRLLSDEFLAESARSGNLVFLKDVSCSLEIQKRRAKLVEKTGLALFNANTSTLLESLQFGYDGYNGVMGNFHIDIYKWLYNRRFEQSEQVRQVMDFLTLAAVCEARCYPVNAKFHAQLCGLPLSLCTRVKSPELLVENSRHEIEALVRAEERMRTLLKKWD